MAKHPAVKHFDPELLLSTLCVGAPVSYRNKTKIFRQGDAATSVFYIVSGEVKLTVVSAQGREAVIAILGNGMFFGEGCLVGQDKRIATATSFGSCEALQIPRKTLRRVMREKPDFADIFLHHLLTRAVRVEADLVDHLFNSSERRLARALLLLANFGKKKRPDHVIGKISQETLADMIGTTRSRVSFFMNKFRRLGFISYNGGLSVHNALLTVVLTEPPPRTPKTKHR